MVVREGRDDGLLFKLYAILLDSSEMWKYTESCGFFIEVTDFSKTKIASRVTCIQYEAS